MRRVKEKPAGITAISAPATTPATLARMDEIQQNMRTLCEPHYDEFHKTRISYGFVTITIPKKTRR